MSLSNSITKLRNASRRRLPVARLTNDKVTRSFVSVLCAEGYVWGSEISDGELVVSLKYGIAGEPVLRELRIRSTSSRRVYCNKESVEPVLGGIGTLVLSTSAGMLSDRSARKLGLGGEVIAVVS